jgi:hypothetical protein
MATKSEKRAQERRLERIRAEREAKKAANVARVERKEQAKALGPAVPLFRRAGQWLNQLQTVSPALANDEVLLAVAKVSLLLRGMYRTRFDEAQKAGATEPTRKLVELQVALQVLDALGTGLSGAAIPEAWDLVAKNPVQQDAQDGADQQSADAAQNGDAGEPVLGAPEAAVEAVDAVGVPTHGGNVGDEGR